MQNALAVLEHQYEADVTIDDYEDDLIVVLSYNFIVLSYNFDVYRVRRR